MAEVHDIDQQTDEQLNKAYQSGYEFTKGSGILEQIKGLWDEFEERLADQAKLAGCDSDSFVDGAANAVADMVDEEIVMIGDEEEGE